MACLVDRLGKSAKNSALEFPFHTICSKQAKGRSRNLEGILTTVQGRLLDKKHLGIESEAKADNLFMLPPQCMTAKHGQRTVQGR